MSTVWLKHKLRCEYSGLVIGVLEIQTTAGAVPYLSHWDKQIVRHPVFSLEQSRLLRFAQDEWRRLTSRTSEELITQDEQDLMSVTYLAMLHSLDCVRQDMPALPPFHLVQSTIGQLFALSFWKWKLESERFRFPTFHISRVNRNDDFSNLPDYLQLCFEVRKDYETKKHTLAEEEKLRSTEKALQALSNTWITPPSKKILWQWIKAHIDPKWQPDTEGWLSTLFLGGSAAILDFQKEDIELARQIIESSCPVGTGILHAVRARLDLIEETWRAHYTTFEVELSDFADNAGMLVNGQPVLAPDPGPAPREQDFSKRSLYIVAEAKWRIAHAAWKKQQL